MFMYYILMNQIDETNVLKDNTLSYSDITDVGKSLTKQNPTYNYSPNITIDKPDYVVNSDLDTIWTKQKNINERQIVEKKLKRVYNLSIVEITEKVLTTITNIVSDLIEWSNSKKRDLNGFIDIFIKSDRLVYIGILSLVIAVILFLISSTSGSINPKSPPALSIKLI